MKTFRHAAANCRCSVTTEWCEWAMIFCWYSFCVCSIFVLVKADSVKLLTTHFHSLYLCPCVYHAIYCCQCIYRMIFLFQSFNVFRFSLKTFSKSTEVVCVICLLLQWRHRVDTSRTYTAEEELQEVFLYEWKELQLGGSASLLRYVFTLVLKMFCGQTPAVTSSVCFLTSSHSVIFALNLIHAVNSPHVFRIW